MYYRSFRSEVRNIPGNGLSLFLAKQLIEFWGGQIEAEGIPNQGSTFRFRLPLKQD
jgi:signal transduction histidine kinase